MLSKPGWNRFTLEVADLATLADKLRADGVHLRGDIIVGVGGDQLIVDDPSGNPIELFQPKRDEARLQTNRG